MNSVWIVFWVFAAEAALMFLVAYRWFAVDKAAAADGRRRVPEALLLFSIASGGALGALLAMHDLHHKTNPRTKWHFRITSVVSLTLQILTAGALLYFALTVR